MNEESLFAAALERATVAERRAFLEGACQGDAALRRRVERLLEAHERSPGILDRTTAAGPPGPATIATGSDPGEALGGERAGTLVAGRYKLLEEVGEGGMGTVWVAEQTQPVRRKVALKLVKAGMDSRAVLARFEAERQALALMDHPNIAKVLDGGTTEGGRPFFVMEYVKGVPLTQYCDDARLSIAERLALFVAVCQAVQHAHTKGVVHRDLKPANILVGLSDGQAVPKVIDFGLAKAMHQPLTEHTLHTALGVVIGTPLYISPEQAEFDRLHVDTRTDVYALGVILYELLTGTTPLERGRFQKAAWHEMLRLIKEEEPPRPSARLSGSDSLPSLAAQRQLEPVRLTRLVRGELDWIVMRCLEKDPSRRYETANGLARDVERYLADESVEACPPSAGYRLGKFVRRNRKSVLAASTIVLLLLGGIVGTTWGLIRADRARRAEADRAEGEQAANARAQKRLRQIEKGGEILAAVFTDLDPHAEEKEGRPLRAILGDRLTQAAEQLEGEGVGDPLVVARLQGRLGVSLLRLGLADRAIPLFDNARATRATLLGADHPDTLESMNDLAEAYRIAGMLDRALPLHEETLEMRKARLGPDHPDTLSSINNLGLGYRSAGKLDQALPLLEEAFARARVKLGPDHPDTLIHMNNLGVTYRIAGEPCRALPLLKEALALTRARMGPDHPDTLMNMNHLAVAYRAAGKLDRALPLLEETLRLRTAKLGPDHIDTLSSMNNLAEGYRTLGDLERALPLYEEVLRVRKARLGPDHPDTLISMNNLGLGYRIAGKLDRALPLLEEAVARARVKLGPDHPDTLINMNNLAVAYRASGTLARAIPLLEESLALTRAKLGPDHPDTLMSMNNLGLGYRSAGKLDRALPLLEKTLELRRAKLGPDHPDTVMSLYHLGSAYRAAGETARALPLFREAAAVLETRRFDLQSAGQILASLIGSLEQAKRFDEAEPWRRKWLAVLKDKAGADSLRYARELGALGANLLHQKKWADAEPVLREALALLEKTEPGARATLVIRSRLGSALLGRKRYAEAMALLIRWSGGVEAREGPTSPDVEQARILSVLERTR